MATGTAHTPEKGAQGPVDGTETITGVDTPSWREEAFCVDCSGPCAICGGDQSAAQPYKRVNRIEV